MVGALSLLVLSSSARLVVGQFPGMPGMPSEARPIPGTSKYIECSVCKVATQEVWDQAASAREAAPWIGEDKFQEIAEGVCNPDLDGGEWITFYDLVQAEKGAAIKLEKNKYLGECRRECRSIAKACRTVYDEVREDVAESLYKRDASTAEKFKSRVCQKWAGVCPAKKVPENFEHPDEFWMPVDEEMYKMKRMQQMINKQAEKYGKQQVQFVDPMQNAMYMDPDEMMFE